MADKPLTLDDLKQATGVVGEPDSAPQSSVPQNDREHPYGDDGHGSGTGAVLDKLGAKNKYITPGTGQ